MKNIIFAAMVSLGVASLAGCASHGQTKAAASPANVTAAGGTNELSDLKERRSYAIGMSLGHTFQTQGVEVDPKTVVRGLTDLESGGTTLLTVEQMRDVITEYQKELSVKRQQFFAAIGITNKQVGEAFLATNKNSPGVITLPDGLQYTVLTNGNGELPGSNDVVTVNYRGMLLDGSEFDSSYKRGHSAQFPVGNVIHGWTEALLQMSVGSKWKLFVPADLAYGEQNRPGIPPNSLLIFEVELLATDHPKPPAPITSDIVKVPSLEEMQKGAKIEVIKSEDAAKAQAAQTNVPPK